MKKGHTVLVAGTTLVNTQWEGVTTLFVLTDLRHVMIKRGR